MTSKRLTGKNTRTSRSAASSLTAFCSEPNQESRKFTSLNCLKKFNSDSVTIPKPKLKELPPKLIKLPKGNASTNKRPQSEPRKKGMRRLSARRKKRKRRLI